MGAAGRDFHNFNTFFRNNPNYKVVAFTATQIRGIADRVYPAILAGELYPQGIPILPEDDLEEIIKEYDVDKAVLAYSDISYKTVGNLGARVLASGADFVLMGTKRTMIKSSKPVIAVCAVRTGAGKSQTTRRIAKILRNAGLSVVAIRHPMPYGDLSKQICQRFGSIEDLKKHDCTIEEMEEYEPHINIGITVFAGVDFQEILKEAEKEADVILWDGGNNDLPFYHPDLMITVADPHRAGHERTYYPGETNAILADVVVINKVDTADRDSIDTVINNIRKINPKATIVEAASPVAVDNENLIRGKKVLVIEDGPTLTHGNMAFGAGAVAARRLGAKFVDPRPYAVGSLKEVFENYSQLTDILPAMGYGDDQVKELEETIAKVDCDAVVIGTPINLSRIMTINKPHTRVRYDLQELSKPDLETIVQNFIREKNLGSS